jgi:hypothetical protein
LVEYITEALHLDQGTEPTRKEMLERVVERQALRQLRDLSWSLRDKLHVITTQLEFTHVESQAALGAVR